MDCGRFVDSNNIPDELKCPVCSLVLLKPKRPLHCDHYFCSECIERWLLRSGECPICRSRASRDMLQPGTTIQNMIGRLKIFCRHKSQGCDEILTVDQLENHEINCPCAVVHCEHCSEELSRSELTVHAKRCRRPCPHYRHGCEYRATGDVMVEHLAECWFERGKKYIEKQDAKIVALELLISHQATAIDRLLSQANVNGRYGDLASVDSNRDLSGIERSGVRSEGIQITLRVRRRSDHNEVFFRIKTTSRLRRLLQTYCERMQVDMQSTTFTFKGERLSVVDDTTPGQLNMQDGDVIDAML